MSIVEYTGPSSPQEIRKYLMRRTKDEIVHEYLRQWREFGEIEKERERLKACWEEEQRAEADLRDMLEKAKAERDDLEYRYHLLASEMVYEGNSVQHWQQKAKAYKECAGAVYGLKQLVGAGTPAEVVKAVQALAAHVERWHETARTVLDGLDFATRYSQGHAPTSMSAVGREFSRLHGLLQETPATSLARLKAEAEQAFADWAEHDLTQDGLFINFEKLLERYRRQAEGRHP